jgi:energy-coupling factor transporter ATP-binding protein EcfA2
LAISKRFDVTSAHDRLGPPAAERDHDLGQYFFESETFAAIASGQATILIGNRGSGKSAIFKTVGDREKKTGTAVINISPEEYSYEFLGKVLKAEIDGAWAKQASYAASHQVGTI